MKIRGPLPEGTGPSWFGSILVQVNPEKRALRGGLDVADPNHAGRLVESAADSHLLATEAPSLGLVVELVGGSVGLQNILLFHLDHYARECLRALSVG